jgi:hypothetical protein
VRVARTGLIGTAVDHVQAVLAHSLYALALMFTPKLSSHTQPVSVGFQEAPTMKWRLRFSASSR